MIPLKLTVKNFMCYRDNVPILDLQGIHVACLCGDNGHGKSALLDSITWALWGQARARTHDELVHQGLDNMAVELEFSARDQRYKVSRRYGRRGKQGGSTILELQVSSGNDFTPITGNSIRETETRIREILQMDYDTFVNTAFLLQGKADMFTGSTPARRKEVLAEVLALSYYSVLEERAKEKLRAIKEQMDKIENGIDIRRFEVDRRSEHKEALRVVTSNFEKLGIDLASERGAFESLQEGLNVLRNLNRDMDELESRIGKSAIEITELDRRLEVHCEKITEAERLILREPEVLRGFDELEKTRKEVERLQDSAFIAAEYEKDLSRLSETIAVERARIVGDADRTRALIKDELEPRVRRREAIDLDLQVLLKEQDDLNDLHAEIGRLKTCSLRWRDELGELGKALESVTSLEARIAGIEREIAVLETHLSSQVEHQAQTVNNLKVAADSIKLIESQIRETDKENQGLGNEKTEIFRQRESLSELDEQISYLRQANKILRNNMDELRRKFDMLHEEDPQCPICKQTLGVDSKEHLKSEYEEQGLQGKRDFTKNSNEIQSLTDIRERLLKETSLQEAGLVKDTRRIDQKMAMLESQLGEANKSKELLSEALETHEHLSNNLKLGKFALDERAQLNLLEQERLELAYSPDRREQLEHQVFQVQEKIETLQNDLDSRRQTLEPSKAVLDAELKECNRAFEELESLRPELNTLDDLIATESFAKEERQRYGKLEDDLEKLGYDAVEHQATQESSRKLEPYAELSLKLKDAKTTLGLEKEALIGTTNLLERLRSERSSDMSRHQQIRGQVDSMKTKEQESEAARASLDLLEQQVIETDAERRHLIKLVDHLNELQEQVNDMETERKMLIDQKSIYDELVVAFGRNGIQALIIESAIPQLQDDANELLGRLTENRMFLKLQLQEGRRDRRLGVPSEELHISISDEVGTRSYETFSGGESFRINFALRIGLSKLLARRSGAPLPILFIDEGFGSQDAAGQERLKEAIQSIQGEFQKIIVITHVEQVKEAFPVRIEVEKTSLGSVFSVV